MSEINKNCKLCCAKSILYKTAFNWDEEYTNEMDCMLEMSVKICNSVDLKTVLDCDKCVLNKLKKEFIKFMYELGIYIDINIEKCSPEKLKFMTDFDVNIIKKLDGSNNTYLIKLMRNSKNIVDFDEFVEKVNILIDAGNDVNAQNNNGETAMMELIDYCENGKHLYNLAKLLLEKGADKTINVTTNKNRYNTCYNRVLYRALNKYKHENIIEIVKLFVDYGLKPMENKDKINYGYYKDDEKIRKQIEDLLFPLENGEKIREIIASFKSFVEIAKENIANAENKIAELEAIIVTIH